MLGPVCCPESGPEYRRYSDSLRDRRFGDRTPVGAKFSAPVQTGPGVHPASYTMGTESFPGVKRPGRGVDHPLLVPRLQKEQSYTSTPPVGLRGLLQSELQFSLLYFTILYFILLYFTLLYFTLLYFTLLYFTLLYFTLLYFTLCCPETSLTKFRHASHIIYFTLLYFTLLYLLYFTLLYFTLLYFTLLYFMLSRNVVNQILTCVAYHPIKEEASQSQDLRAAFLTFQGSLKR